MIEVSNLRKRFGDNEALKGISFRVQPGEIYGLLGPNGAGKSTTIGILCGLVRPDAGQASLKGIDIARHPVEARRVLGVVPQEVALYTEFSARDNLKFFGQLYGLSGAALASAIDLVLQRVGLADRAKEPIEGFSGGMLRRLNIAAGPAARAERRADGRADGRPRPADPGEHPRPGEVDRHRRRRGRLHDALPRRGRAPLRSHRHHRSRRDPGRRHAAGTAAGRRRPRDHRAARNVPGGSGGDRDREAPRVPS